MEENRYASYQGMMAKVATALSGMGDLCGRLQMDESRTELAVSRERLENHRFSVGIMGEFKRGKSTVINSLLEQEVMPADILPCSATMNRVTYDLKPRVDLKMADGSVKSIAVEELTDYVTKLTPENESRAAEVEEAIVCYPCRFCQNGVDIIDTPGLNDDDRMTRISEEIIPKLDAVIMVTVPGAPFSLSEADFVRNKLMTSELSRIIFLVNKIDQVRRPADRERVVNEIRDRVRETILEKMKNMYGEDSDQYRDAQMKLGQIRIFPISALDALEGKMAGDQEMIDKSGTLPFEEVLTHMLTEERGALELSRPIVTLEKAANRLLNTVEMRKNALTMDSEIFKARQQEALAQFKEMREQKKAEEQHLRRRADEVTRDMRQRVRDIHPEIKSRMMKVVDDFNPDPKPYAKKAGAEQGAKELQAKLTAEMNDAISELTEKTLVELQDVLNVEATNAGNVLGDMQERLNGIMANIADKNLMDGNAMIATGLELATDFFGICGVGGAITGYQVAGFKGAAFGAVTSAIIHLGIILGLGITGLPLILLTSLVSTVASKKLTESTFQADTGRENLANIKMETRKNIITVVRELQDGHTLEDWIEHEVVERFDELIAAVEREYENTLTETEAAMNQIREDLAKDDSTREDTLKRLEDIETRCQKIIEELKPTANRVRDALAM